MWIRTLCWALPGALLLAGAAGAAKPSGVMGKAGQVPGCPGPQRIDQGPCVAPLGELKLELRDGAGRVVGSATTGPDGRFKIHAPAGSYRLRALIEGVYPRCPELRVKVANGAFTTAELECDSGMR